MERITYMGTQVYPKTRRARNGRFTFKSWMRYQWTRFTRWLWKWTVRVGIALATLGILTAVFYAGGIIMSGNEISTTNVIIAAAAVEAKTPPVLDRIAQAESHKSQFCTAALVKAGMCRSYEIGQVLHHVNKDGTIDTGYYQINSVHGAEATKLGYDLDKEADNKAFAEYLYQNYGTEPWSSSKANW